MLQIISAFLNHRLVAGILLIVLGGIGTYIVVPKIQDANLRRRIIGEEKVKAIGEFIKNNQSINSELPIFRTSLLNKATTLLSSLLK